MIITYTNEMHQINAECKIVTLTAIINISHISMLKTIVSCEREDEAEDGNKSEDIEIFRDF